MARQKQQPEIIVWTDKWGTEHDITKMPSSYLRNVLKMLIGVSVIETLYADANLIQVEDGVGVTDASGKFNGRPITEWLGIILNEIARRIATPLADQLRESIRIAKQRKKTRRKSQATKRKYTKSAKWHKAHGKAIPRKKRSKR